MKWLFFLIPLILSANILDQKIIDLIGKERFQKNRIILHTLFANPKRVMKKGKIDVVKLASILQRIGLLPEALSEVREWDVEAFTYTHDRLFFLLFEKGLYRAGIFNYQLLGVRKDSDGFSIHLTYRSNRLPNPVVIGKFLSSHGVDVIDIKRQKNHYFYLCDAKDAFLDAKLLEKKLKIETISNNVTWLRNSGFQKLLIIAKSNHWHPRITIFDRYLNPLTTIYKGKIVKRFEVQLPKGSYYIKISDIYENIKRGFILQASKEENVRRDTFQ